MSGGIELNTYYQIVFAPNPDADEKCTLVTQLLSQPEYDSEFIQLFDYLTFERVRQASQVADAAKSPAGATGLMQSLQDANENLRRTYALLTEGARKAPEGSLGKQKEPDLRAFFASLADETVRIKQLASEGMALTARVTVRSKPLTFK